MSLCLTTGKARSAALLILSDIEPGVPIAFANIKAFSPLVRFSFFNRSFINSASFAISSLGSKVIELSRGLVISFSGFSTVTAAISAAVGNS